MAETDAGHVGGREIAIETMMVIVALAIVAGAVYFWAYAHGTDLTGNQLISSAQQRLAAARPTPAQLAESLRTAESRLAEQSAALASLKADFPSSPALDGQITDAYASAAAAVAKTDKLFNDPDSNDPTLKDAETDPAAAAAIESLRREINADLAAWPAASSGSASTLALSQKALADLEAMQAYIDQLQNYFAALPPSNALQSDVIIADQSQLADDGSAVNGAIDAVDAVGAPPIATASPSPTPEGGSNGSGGSGGTGSSGGSSSGGSPSSGSSPSADNGASPLGSPTASPSPTPLANPPSGVPPVNPPPVSPSPSPTPPPIVTVADVQQQQDVVDQTMQEIGQLQGEIQSSDGSGQSGSSGDSGAGSGPGVPPSGGSSSSGSDGSSFDQSYYSWAQPWSPVDQPTGPQLIQGDNPFQ